MKIVTNDGFNHHINISYYSKNYKLIGNTRTGVKIETFKLPGKFALRQMYFMQIKMHNYNPILF